MIEGDAVVHELCLPVAPDEAFEMFVDPTAETMGVPPGSSQVEVTFTVAAITTNRTPAPCPTEAPEEPRRWLSTS